MIPWHSPCKREENAAGHAENADPILRLIGAGVPSDSGAWKHDAACGNVGVMIEFRPLADDHPDLAHSPMLRAALLTLQ